MRASAIVLLLTASLAVGSAHAQATDKPGAFASADTKLDYLLKSWKGRTVDELKGVWGALAGEPRGSNQVYVYERMTSGARAGVSVFGGQVSRSTNAAITCTVSFEADSTGTIIQVTRQRGGRPCWNLFRDYSPPE